MIRTHLEQKNLNFRTNWEEVKNGTSAVNKNSTALDFDYASMTWMNTDLAIYIYSGLILATFFLALFRSYLFFNVCMRASVNLHNSMFSSITRATMYFFNTNPSGKRKLI